MSDLNMTLLQDVLEIAFDSRSFYAKAADAVESPALKQEFRRIANAKDELIDKLSCHLRARSAAPDVDTTFAGSLREVYTKALSALSTRDGASYHYTSALEETEDRMLKHFIEAMNATDSPAIKATLMEQLPTVRACHEDMKRLKESLAA